MIYKIAPFQSRFAGIQNQQTKEPKIPWQLKRLFKLLPKTEEHVHLSGSARKTDIEIFMLENGFTKPQVKKEMKLLKPSYKNLTDFLDCYYRIPKHVYTPSQFKRATIGLVKKAAQENVRILEIRSSLLNKGGTPEEIAFAIEEGLREGMSWVKKRKGYNMKTALIILAQRGGSPKDSMKHARLAIDLAKKPGSLIKGFDLAGDEIKHSVDNHKEAIRYIKQHGADVGIHLTLHAGEVPSSDNISGLESIKKALEYGAERIGHGLQLKMDSKLKQYFIKKQIPVELCPWSNVQTGAIKTYKEHPVKKFLKDGVNISLNTDNRLISKIDLTRQLGQLWQNGLISRWNQLEKLILNGVSASFISAEDKKQVQQDIETSFKNLEQRFERTIKKYL